MPKTCARGHAAAMLYHIRRYIDMRIEGMVPMRYAGPLVIQRDRTSGERLKQAMKDAGATVRSLSEATNLSEKTIQNLRNGRSQGNTATWRVIARRLRVDIDWLLGGE